MVELIGQFSLSSLKSLLCTSIRWPFFVLTWENKRPEQGLSDNIIDLRKSLLNLHASFRFCSIIISSLEGGKICLLFYILDYLAGL